MMKKIVNTLGGNNLATARFVRALFSKALFSKALFNRALFSRVLIGTALLGLSSCTLFKKPKQDESTQQPMQKQQIANQTSRQYLEDLLNCKSAYAEYMAFTEKVANQTRITLENGMMLTHHKNELSEIAREYDLPDYRIYELSQPIKVEAGYPAQFFRKPPPGSPKVEQPTPKPDTFVSSRIGIGHNRIVAYVNETPSQVFYSLDVTRVNTKRLPYIVEAYKPIDGDLAKKRYASSQPDAGKFSLLGCEYRQ